MQNYGFGFLEPEGGETETFKNKQVKNKMSKVRPIRLLEAQLIRDIDLILEANYHKPQVAITLL